MTTFSYKPGGETLRQFLLCDTFFTGLRGPVGSGKSAACCIKIFKTALTQAPAPNGKRKTRHAIVRNTYAELRTTTLATWKDWFPEDVWGPVRMHPPPFEHHLQKGDLDCEVLFLALDRPEDVKKLLSLELTTIWLNEARELAKSIVDAATMRVGRYPSMKDGGPTWYGVFADTNAPDEDHWWPIVAGEAPIPDHISPAEAKMLVQPNNWRFFTQPGGMIAKKDAAGDVVGYEINPAAENLHNLTPGYYPNLVKGKGADWIKVYVLNELASLSDGKPVYPDFDQAVHVAKEPLAPIPGLELVVGVDFGLTPAAIITQPFRGRCSVLEELVATDMGVVRFTQLLKELLATRYAGFRVRIFGDPAGDYRAQTDETTPFQLMRSGGLAAFPAPGNNDVSLRIEAVASGLCQVIDKQPGLLIDPTRCPTLVRGFAGGYHYRRLQVSGAERFEDSPNKNKFSHPHDALQYARLGAGAGRDLLNHGATGGGQRVARVPFDPFNRVRATGPRIGRSAIAPGRRSL